MYTVYFNLTLRTAVLYTVYLNLTLITGVLYTVYLNLTLITGVLYAVQANTYFGLFVVDRELKGEHLISNCFRSHIYVFKAPIMILNKFEQFYKILKKEFPDKFVLLVYNVWHPFAILETKFDYKSQCSIISFSWLVLHLTYSTNINNIFNSIQNLHVLTNNASVDKLKFKL